MQSETQIKPDPARFDRPMPFSPQTGCVITVIAAVVLLCVGLISFQIAFRGGLTLRQSSLRETRLWLVNSGETHGVGLSSMQRVSGSERADEICLRTKVTFWFWSGEQPGMNTSYCECFIRSEPGWLPAGACPE
jgi:hypothetical protein